MSDATRQNVDELQRALASTVRALAGDGTVDVAFRGRERGGKDRGGTAGHAVRLALPRSDLIRHEIARVRGEADRAAQTDQCRGQGCSA